MCMPLSTVVIHHRSLSLKGFIGQLTQKNYYLNRLSYINNTAMKADNAKTPMLTMERLGQGEPTIVFLYENVDISCLWEPVKTVVFYCGKHWIAGQG